MSARARARSTPGGRALSPSRSPRSRAVRRRRDAARRALRRQPALRARARLGAPARRGARDLPDTVERLLTTRIDTLEPVDRMLLRYAAVVGPSFELSLLGDPGRPSASSRIRRRRSTAGPRCASSSSTPARAARVPARPRPRDRLRGALVPAAAPRSTDASARRSSSGSATGPTRRPALLSLHFHEAREYERSWRYAVSAGPARRRASRTSSPPSSTSAPSRPPRRRPGSSPARSPRVAEALGDVCERFGDYEPRGDAYERAPRARRRTTSSSRPASRASGACSTSCRPLPRGHRRLRARARRLEDAADDPELTRNRIDLEIGIAGVHYRQGQFAEAIAWGERAAAPTPRSDDRGRLAHAYYLLANYDLGHPDGIRSASSRCRSSRSCGPARPGARAQQPRHPPLLRGPLGRVARRLPRRARRDAARRRRDRRGMLANNEGEILSDQGHLRACRGGVPPHAAGVAAAGYAIGAALATSNPPRVAARGTPVRRGAPLYGEALDAFDAIEAALLRRRRPRPARRVPRPRGPLRRGDRARDRDARRRERGGAVRDPRERVSARAPPGSPARRSPAALRGEPAPRPRAAADYDAALTCARSPTRAPATRRTRRGRRDPSRGSASCRCPASRCRSRRPRGYHPPGRGPRPHPSRSSSATPCASSRARRSRRWPRS